MESTDMHMPEGEYQVKLSGHWCSTGDRMLNKVDNQAYPVTIPRIFLNKGSYTISSKFQFTQTALFTYRLDSIPPAMIVVKHNHQAQSFARSKYIVVNWLKYAYYWIKLRIQP